MLPYGPKKINASRQVAIPDELMQAARLQVGDSIYFFRNDDPPGALIVPVEVVAGWIEKGRGSMTSATEEQVNGD
jgi:hypothetical protein